LPLGFPQAVGRGIQYDRGDHERDPSKEHQGIAGRRKNIAADCAYNQRKTDAYGKGHCQPSDINGRHQQQIGDVEDDATDNRKSDVMDTAP
jgi:hypothetical protein